MSDTTGGASVQRRSLAEVRAACGLTVRALAERAGISPSTVYLIEHGKTVAQLDVARRLSEALGVGPWEVDELARAIEYRMRPRRPRRTHEAGAGDENDEHAV